MILIGLSLIFGNWAWAQSDDADIPVELSLRDLKEIDRRLQDYEILKEMDKAKDDRIGNLEKDLNLARKELDLEKRENDLNQRMIGLLERKIELDKQSFDQLKEVADRAIKLAETKKSSLWETYGPLAAIAIIVVTIAAIL
jgi:hypothetical protein